MLIVTICFYPCTTHILMSYEFSGDEKLVQCQVIFSNENCRSSWCLSIFTDRSLSLLSQVHIIKWNSYLRQTKLHITVLYIRINVFLCRVEEQKFNPLRKHVNDSLLCSVLSAIKSESDWKHLKINRK